MKRFIKPLITILLLVSIIMPVIIFSKRDKEKKDVDSTTKNTTIDITQQSDIPSSEDNIKNDDSLEIDIPCNIEDEISGADIPTPFELPNGVSNDVATKVYSSIAVELMSSGYDVFNAVKITSEGSEYGFGYTDYAEFYSNDDYNKTFLAAGFISFSGENNRINNDDLTFINYIDEFGHEFYDEKYSFVYSYNDTAIKKGHMILNNKYVKYEIEEGYLNIDILECKKDNYDFSIGSIYNYDLHEYEFIPYDEIDSSPDEVYPLIEHFDSIKIKQELANTIKKQNDNGNIIEGIYISYISNDALQTYINKETHINSLNGINYADLDKIEYNNENEMICFGENGDVYIKKLPYIVPLEYNKGLWDYVVDGLVMAGTGAVAVVGVVASSVTGGASLVLSAAAIGAGVQYFSETIINGKKFEDVNWTKVAIMSVSGAIGAAIPCAGVAGYFVSGIIGGVTSGIMTALDGASSEEILTSSVKGATISLLTHGLFSTCFIKGTKVLTDKGLINIENIRKGMYVLSYNELSNICEYKRVLETYENTGSYFTDLTLSNGEFITSTYSHPYYVPSLKQYIKAGFLEKGMCVIDKNGSYVQVKSARNYYKNEVVYNFNVDVNHNYYVGYTSILVHNSCAVATTNKIDINSEALSGMVKTVGSVLISKPAIVSYTTLLSASIITSNSRINNVESINTLSIEIGNVVSTCSDLTIELSEETYENGLKKKTKDALNDLKNTGQDDYGWDDESLGAALQSAFNISKNGELSKVDATDKEKERIIVYLGRYEKDEDNKYNYYEEAEKAAKDEDNICCFSMNDSLWNSLSNKYGINGMYLLNKIFLDYVVSLDCVFKLMAPPGLYYSQTIKRIVLGKENTSYANELEYINKKYFYGWNSNYEIGQIADRGK